MDGSSRTLTRCARSRIAGSRTASQEKLATSLDPVASRDVFIEANDTLHYWSDDPLFIFDDTVFHRSINDVDHVRYCLFMDIVRPNYVPRVFDVAVQIASFISGAFKQMFYRNWSFVR